MAQLLKKENITVIIGTYQKDGKEKKKYRTIGELVTMQGDDGSVYQFGEIWGPHGATSINIYSQDDAQQQAPQQGYQQAPQQAPQQQGYSQAPHQGQYHR
jgi:hypothetical protein